MKLTPAGAVAWSTTYAGIGPDDDFPYKLVLDSSSRVFVAGNIWSGDRYFASLQRYDTTTGAVLWTRTFTSSSSGAAAFTAMADGNGFVYVAGTDWASGARGLLRKFDVNGNLIFSMVCAEPDTIGERYLALARDKAGNVIVGGSAIHPDRNVDLLVAKYTPSGALIWKRLYNGPGQQSDLGKFLAVDPFDGVYLAGNVSGGPTGKDYGLWRLNSDGTPGWPDSGDGFTHSAVIFDSGLNLADSVAGLGVDAGGAVYIVGSAIGDSETYDLNAIKFGPTSDATFLGQIVPSTMIAGQTYTVSITYGNSSNVTWTSSAGYTLGSLNPVDNSTWGFNRVALASNEAIKPGDPKKFQFRINAPLVAGTYNFQWQMRNGIGLFGQPSLNKAVVVSVAPDAAKYLSQTQASTVKVGASFAVTVKIQNVGTNTWTQPGGYNLAPSGSSSNWNVTSVSLGSLDSIAPSQTKTFSFTCKAPLAAGTYTMRFQLRKGTTFFGDQTTLKTITVTP